ncbi:MAG: hypothetical protein Q8N60_02020 [Candidatus Diapherotrites archaeon]|nr:hypothetical protein [Candidatus Diapherotrites archaeon]
MNNKGIFCFLLLLSAIALETNFLNESIEADKILAQGKTIAFEAEKASFIRTAIENNTDAMIRESLQQAIMLNVPQEELKDFVNKRLAMLFAAAENEYKGEIDKGKIKVQFRATGCPASGGLSLEDFLKENSTALIVSVKGKTVLAEYDFTGGLLRNCFVEAEIAGERTKTVFRLPPGYSIKATVVG